MTHNGRGVDVENVVVTLYFVPRSIEAVAFTIDTVITTTTDNTESTVLNIYSDGDGIADTQRSVDAYGETILVDLDKGASLILLSPKNLSIEGIDGGQITEIKRTLRNLPRFRRKNLL